MKTRREDEFERFVRIHRTRLLRTAVTLTAGDPHLAEDLVQTALVRVYLARPSSVSSDAAMYAYTRRAVVNGLIDHHRRPFVRRERTTDDLPDAPTPTVADLGERGARLLNALAMVPEGMRAAVVLRHVEGLSVEETADALGCSTGTVKSQTARGLDRLRDLLDLTTTDIDDSSQHTAREGEAQWKTS